MKTFEVVPESYKVTFYSPEEYKTILGGSLEGEFVAAMECYIFHYEDAQAIPWRGCGVYG